MPIDGDKKQFDFTFISEVPDKSGVYALWDSQQVVFYGKSARSIRQDLQSHKIGKKGWCGFGADSFQFEVTDHPDSREMELMIEHIRRYGRLPRCNDRLP